jgi:hypothetical protein
MAPRAKFATEPFIFVVAFGLNMVRWLKPAEASAGK